MDGFRRQRQNSRQEIGKNNEHNVGFLRFDLQLIKLKVILI